MNNVAPVSILSPEPPHASKSSKIINKVIMVALVVIALSLGLFLRWTYQSTDVIQIKNAPFPTRTITQGSDEAIIMTLDYCKTQTITGDLRVSYVSKTREVFLPIQKERSPIGCQKGDFPILVPKDLPTDTYKIKFHTTYDINPLKQNVTQDFYSQEITVGGQSN